MNKAASQNADECELPEQIRLTDHQRSSNHAGEQDEQAVTSMSHQNPDHPKYSIAVAAELSATPQQQLRRMEDRGLLAPQRTAGKTRRYSDNDLQHIAEINHLASEGLNMEGIRYALELHGEVRALRRELAAVRHQLEELRRLLDDRQERQ